LFSTNALSEICFESYQVQFCSVSSVAKYKLTNISVLMINSDSIV